MSNYLNARHGIEIWHYDGKTQIIGGAVDPTVEGVEANIGSLYLHTNGSHYKKIGSNNTEWVLLIEESPQDGKLYGRRNGEWLDIDTATGSSPGGNNQAIQFNNEDVFDGTQEFKYNKDENKLIVSNLYIKPDGEKVGLWVL